MTVRIAIAYFSVVAASYFTACPVAAQPAPAEQAAQPTLPAQLEQPAQPAPTVQAAPPVQVTPPAQPVQEAAQPSQRVQAVQAAQPAKTLEPANVPEPAKPAIVAKPIQISPPTQAAKTPPAPPLTHPAQIAAWWTDAGRILAGEMPNAGSNLGKLANQLSVQQHRGAFARSWTPFETSRLKPAMKFAQNEITTQSQAEGPVYYPFSGPDAMYALGMFPKASTFALAGLEPVGGLPDISRLSDADLNASLAELRRSLRSISAFSFFRTNDMRAEFSRNQFSGVTPILLLFITRQGFEVQNVEQVVMEPDATVRVTNVAGLKNLSADRVPGVRMTFIKPGETKSRTLYYFTADLSDQGLAKVPQPLKWAENFAPKATYIKSASYLLHMANFSQVRNFIIGKTELIVQDDSGIPVRYFSATNWDRTFFGTYNGPIRLFANRYQKDLREAYAKSAKTLGFGIGYDYQARASNIQRFVRKQVVLENKVTAGGVKVAGQ